MPNIPNFLDVNRKKVDFFSPSSIIRAKGNFLSQGSTTPLPSPTPSQTPSPSITPTITPTVTPTTTPFTSFIVGSGTTSQITTVVNSNFSNSIIFFNAEPETFDPESMGILYNGLPSTSINYPIGYAGKTFVYYPGTGDKKFTGTFVNNSIVNFVP